MLIKKIMDNIESTSLKYVYSDSFILYKNTINRYSDIRFFYFIILNNIGFSKEEKEEIIDLYVEAKKKINNLNFFLKKLNYHYVKNTIMMLTYFLIL